MQIFATCYLMIPEGEMNLYSLLYAVQVFLEFSYLSYLQNIRSCADLDDSVNFLHFCICPGEQVMLMSGMSDDNVKELLSDSEDRPLHIHNILKFAVLRKERSALMAIGGTWDKVLDG